jgi:hypothetical protein
MQTHERLEAYLKAYAVGHKNGKKIEQIMYHLGVKDDKIARDAIRFLRCRSEDRLVIVACPTEGLGYFIPDRNDPLDIEYTKIYISGNKSRQDEINFSLLGAQYFLDSIDEPFLPIPHSICKGKIHEMV